MDLGKRTVQEIKNGYYLEDEIYHCHYCETTFSMNEVYSVGNKLYLGEQRMQQHIELTHEGNIQQLVNNESKYNTLTEKQKELFIAFASGKSDKAIAELFGVSHSTIRHQKFTFREKAKQAKFYLALYEKVFESFEGTPDSLIPIHEGATMVDDRYLITTKEEREVLEQTFASITPLKLHHWPKKEKKKLIVLRQIANEIKTNYTYTEKELTTWLGEIYNDPVTLRRYLYEYGFINRTPDGKAYWITN